MKEAEAHTNGKQTVRYSRNLKLSLKPKIVGAGIIIYPEELFNTPLEELIKLIDTRVDRTQKLLLKHLNG